MATLEQVEKLRDKANVSFEDAKAALDATDGDLLEAIILLEKQGKVPPPGGGGFYSSSSGGSEEPGAGDSSQRASEKKGETFGDMMRRFGRFCGKIFNICNTNYLEAEKNGGIVLSVPVTAVILLLIFLFWLVVPLFLISLFFGFRYRFRGSDFGRDSVNKVMDSATDKAEDLKRSFGSNE